MHTIGILGAAGIAVSAVIVPVRRRNDLRVQAVASRSSAADYAARHGIERGYERYDDLLDDPAVDLVYNALPPSLHAEWTIAALRAGKDVLCEKPFAMTAAQASRVRAESRNTGRRAIEAFHDHYHPLSGWVRDAVGSGMVGAVRHAEAVFTGATPFAPNTLRHEPSLGGGALMDLGCYPVHWLRSLFGGTPRVGSAAAVLNPVGADLTTDAELSFDGGVTATVHASMAEGVSLRSALSVEGERGHLRVENIVFPSAGHSVVTEVDGVARALTVAGQQTYDHQLEAVVTALRTGASLPTEGDDPVENMAAIDSIYSAAGFERPWS